ncbi:MAG: hypothetical protein JWP76_3946 [Dactylosporangium sp.]|jgi:hypothetical protein|nr:hypothetical protein [Dactylosporangium sp.]
MYLYTHPDRTLSLIRSVPAVEVGLNGFHYSHSWSKTRLDLVDVVGISAHHIDPAQAPHLLALLIGMMLPGQGSVAPVHDGRDLAYHRAPTQRCGSLWVNFAKSATCEERPEATRFDRPEAFVQIVER